MRPLILAFSILATSAAIRPAIAASTPHGMFELYQANRAEGRPNFITEDFVLLGYLMSIDQEFSVAEERQMLPAMQKIVESLLKALPAKRNETEEAAFAYLTVINALAKGENPTSPASVADELKRIRAADGMDRSELVRQTVDYTQFKPRGRYTRSAELTRYFMATRYAGTVLFPVLESQATGITAADADRLTGEALLIARLIRRDPAIYASYSKLGRGLDLLVGPAEDLAISDLVSIPVKLPIADARKRLLDRARREHRQPAILAAAVDISHLEKGVTAPDVLTGWRMFPLRYTADSAALQQLVFDHVKKYKGNGKPHSLTVISGMPVKGFPQAREVLALLGSKEALKELDATDERNYEGYEQAFQKSALVMKNGHDPATDQLRMLQTSLLRTQPATSDAKEQARRLQTALAFWTWIRYNNSLYTKQSYTPISKGLSLSQERTSAWIEPSASLYLKLADMVIRLKPALDSGHMTELAGLLRRCAVIAKAETGGVAPTKDQTKFLNDLDMSFKKFTGRDDRPIVIDVHTEPNSGLVLEEGIAFPEKVDHKLASSTASGARFKHVEFKQKLSARLNDEEWEAILEKEASR